MATNELTLLRFYGSSEGQIPPMTAEQLAGVCKGLETVFQQVSASSGGYRTSLAFKFALPPRKGCLEFVFEHLVTLLAATPTRPPPLDAQAAGLAIDVATLFYMATFGSHSVMDLFSRGVTPDIPDTPKTPTVEYLRLQVTAMALAQPNVVKALRALVSTAAATGASRVEIVIPDEQPVTIYSTEERKGAGALMKIVNADQLAESTITSVQGAKGPFLTGKMGDKEVTTFLAQPWSGGPPVVVVWHSQHPVPRDGRSVDVKCRKATREDLLALRLDEPMPVTFEEAYGVIVVTAAAVYG